jgi:hypothetical protein
MSNVTTPSTGSIRIAIKRTVDRHETITAAEVVAETAAGQGCPEADVVEALDELERNGLVYLVGDGEDAEVRIP